MATNKPLSLRTALRAKLYLAFITLGCAAFLSGCASLYDPESSQDFHGDVITEVGDGQVFEQQFLAQKPGFRELEFWVDPGESPADQTSRLLVEISKKDLQSLPFYSTSFNIKDLAGDAPLRLSLKSGDMQPGENYSLVLTPIGGSIRLFGRNEDIYYLGNPSLDGATLQADLGMYVYDQYGIKLFIEDIKKIWSYRWVGLALIVLLIVPGWLVLDLAGLARDYDPGEQLGLSVAISMSSIATLMAWTSFVGLRWSRPWVLGIASILALACGWRIIQHIRNDTWRFPRISWTGLSLWGIFGVTLASRLIMVRNLVAPPWVDAIQHGLFTRLILENGGYPGSYAPYLNISGYHTGFHSLLATFCWLTNLDIPTAMLILGQVLNALVIFAIYLLANTWLNSKFIGVIAALGAGLLSPMPAYYTSWSRYPQLAGLLLLPAALALLHRLYTSKTIHTNPRKFSVTIALTSVSALIMSGIMITHYRVAAFFAVLILLDFAIWMLMGKNQTPSLSASLKRLVVSLAITGILVSPWFPKVLSTLIAPRIGIGKPAPIFSGWQTGYITTAYGQQMLVVAGVGFFAALLRRKRFALILLLWVVGLFFLANLNYFHLPGGNFINTNSVEISLFIPISLFFGYCIYLAYHLLVKLLPQIFKRLVAPSSFVVMLCIAGFASLKIISILNPITFLARQPDLQAMPWIETYIPGDSQIMINPFLWGYGLYAGSDGGYWISTMTGRRTVPPPILYGLDMDPEARKNTTEFIAQTITLAGDPQALADLLIDQDIDYVYLGARGGVFSPSRLAANPHYIELYQKEGVHIYQVR